MSYTSTKKSLSMKINLKKLNRLSLVQNDLVHRCDTLEQTISDSKMPSPRSSVGSVQHLRTGWRRFDPRPRIDDSHYDRIHASLIVNHCFDGGYVGKQVWKKILCTVLVNREYVHSVAVYQKYLTRLGELIIFEHWRENYHFSQPS